MWMNWFWLSRQRDHIETCQVHLCLYPCTRAPSFPTQVRFFCSCSASVTAAGA